LAAKKKTAAKKAPARKEPTRKVKPERTVDVPDLADGIHVGISEDVYDRIPAVRSSLLKTVRDHTCKHAREQVLNPKPSSRQMDLGSAIHVAGLEGWDEFEKRVVTGPDHDRRSNANYNAWIDFEVEHHDKYILTPTDLERCKRCVDAVVNHGRARGMLFESQGRSELTLLWTDPETGLRCKARPDRMAHWNGWQCMFDVKTIGMVPTKEKLKRRIGELAYDLSAGHYINGAMQLAPSERHFFWIWIETKAPFTVRVTRPSAVGLAEGQKKAQMALVKWARAVDAGVYPGWGNDVETTDVPKWHQISDEELDEEGGY
jgi:hypothetical protein